MTRDELVAHLAQNMTEAIDMDALIEFYHESTTCFLDALDDEALAVEYNEWFELEDTPVVIEEVKS